MVVSYRHSKLPFFFWNTSVRKYTKFSSKRGDAGARHLAEPLNTRKKKNPNGGSNPLVKKNPGRAIVANIESCLTMRASWRSLSSCVRLSASTREELRLVVARHSSSRRFRSFSFSLQNSQNMFFTECTVENQGIVWISNTNVKSQICKAKTVYSTEICLLFVNLCL